MFVLSGAIYWMKGEVGSLGCGACRRSVDGTLFAIRLGTPETRGMLSPHGRRAAARISRGVPDSMATDTAERAPRATYQDVLDAPAHRVAEIVDGTLHVSPRPPSLQALAKTCLAASLGHAFCFGRGGPGGWWIMHEPELHLGEDILVPDVAGWRRERLPNIPETWGGVIAPDWVCETMSDATREFDLNAKRPVYAREGILHLWLVEPTDRALDAFELHEGQWVRIASVKDDEPVSIRPFDAVTFSLDDLWP